ncbi:MAG: viroplasmin family protein [Flavobacteriales bacterium]
MAKKPKFYVVWQGKTPGVYSTWSACEAQIKGVQGAKYKSFPTKTEAEHAFDQPWQSFYGDTKTKSKIEKTTEADWLDKVGLPEKGSLTVDAACSGNPGKVEYRAVDLDRSKEIFKFGTLEHSTNNIGEFLALVHALAMIEKGDLNYNTVYSDSKTAMAWVRNKRCNSKLKQNAKNQKSFELVRRAELWLKSNTFKTKILKWHTEYWGEIPADFGRK